MAYESHPAIARIFGKVQELRSTIVEDTKDRVLNSKSPRAGSRDRTVLGGPGANQCLVAPDVKFEGGILEHSAVFADGQRLEAMTDVTVSHPKFKADLPRNVALIFEAANIGDANWLQFIGASVLAEFDAQIERLEGELEFRAGRGGTFVLRTAEVPGETQFRLESDGQNWPFTNSADTAVCQSLPNGIKRLVFFDRPVHEYTNVLTQLRPYATMFFDKRGFYPEFMTIMVELYTYLVLGNTPVYLIKWQVEHEAELNKHGEFPGTSGHYAQAINSPESGPVIGLSTEHFNILKGVSPGAQIR